MPNPKVYVFAAGDDASVERMREVGCEIVTGAASWGDPTGDPEDVMIDKATHADALVGTSIKGGRITKKVMQASENLRIVAKYTVGVDEIDVDAATELGIVVTHAPTEANWGAVAETTVQQMLTVLKKARERDEALKHGDAWRTVELTGTHLGSREDGYPGITLGLIGFGRIGTRVAKLMAPWEFRIVAYDPYVDDAKFKAAGVDRVDLQTLLRESDVVSVHVILTRETRHMISTRELEQMKPSAVLINTSRGPAVDEEALVKALQDEVIAGAALDVFEKEPLPMDSPLRKMDDRVLISPHVASHNFGGGIGPGLVWGTDDVLRALRGEVPEHVFNPEVLPRWRERFEGRSAI